MDNKMYFKRKIYDKLVEWKKNSDGKTALLIEGARRIGKSTIVELFAKNEYENYLIIDFNIAPNEIKDLFINERSDIDLILQKLQSFYGKVLPVRKSLIIFDEVQFCPEARSMIKYLVADGRYDYLETGSLISIKKNVENILIPSEERKINMYPLDFEEFLWTLNDNATIPFLRDCYINKKKVDIAHKRIMKDFRTYILVGGMPQAIAEYINTKSFDRVDEIKRNILSLYHDDINKHEHVIFDLDDGSELRYMDTRKFGKMYLIKKEDINKIGPLVKLGLEPWDDNLTSEYLLDKYKKKKLPIKSVLLDQNIIVGIGNIYADEILFLSKINPLKKCNLITKEEAENIIKYTKKVLEAAIEKGGTTIRTYSSVDGVHGLFQNELFVHGKDKNNCPICNTKIEKIKVGGRGTYYCPKCQTLQ